MGPSTFVVPASIGILPAVDSLLNNEPPIPFIPLVEPVVVVGTTIGTSQLSTPPTPTLIATETRTTSISQVIIDSLRGGAASSSSNNNDGDNNSDEKSSRSSNKSKQQQQQRKKRRNSRKDTTKKDTDDNTKTGEKQKQSSAKTTSTLPIVEEVLKEEDYYKILGITKEKVLQSSNPDREVQKAYRRRAVQTHPDKTNGDRRAFDKVAEAYECLQDEKQRNIYNKFGKNGLEQQYYSGGMHQHHTAEDIFRSFFGGGNNPFTSQQQASRTMKFQLEVTLEDMYNGRSTNVQLPGNGKTISVDIPKGAMNGEQILLSGALDNDDNGPPMDVSFILQQRQHHTYKRKNYDLAIQIHISLAESITGMQRKIKHLNGRTIHIVSAGNNDSPTVIKNGDVHVLKGYGMPKNNLGTEYGDLYIQYQIDYYMKTGGKTNTNQLTKEERRELKRLLCKLEGKPIKESEWPFDANSGKRLTKATITDYGRASGQPEYNTDDNDQQSFFGTNQGFSSGFFPFGAGNAQRFHWSSSTSSQTNPFGGGGFDDDDDETQQCRQM